MSGAWLGPLSAVPIRLRVDPGLPAEPRLLGGSGALAMICGGDSELSSMKLTLPCAPLEQAELLFAASKARA